MEFKAVVLAAGKGSRMVDLTCQMPKCLLPIGGLPMIWYPLRMLQEAGIESALVVVSEQMREHRSEILAVPQLHNLHIRIEVFEVASREDPGTADALRQLSQDRLRSCSSDLLVISCDLVTSAPLRRLLDLHRLEGASLTALFVAPREDAGAGTGNIIVPGPKSRHKPERDLVGLSNPGPRLCLLASEADFEDEVPLHLSLLRQHPRLLIRRDLLDAHLYLLATGMLEFIAEAKQMTSLKGEVIPHIIRAQHRRPRITDSSSDDHNPRSKTANDFLRPGRFSHLTEKFTIAGEQWDKAACFAQMTSDLTWRANTIAAYLAANRAAVKLWEVMLEPRPERVHSTATVPQSRVHLGEDCIIGASSTLSEKTTVISSMIGRHCSLGCRLRLSDCVVMDHVTIADDVTLSNCVLMPHCTVEKGAELKDCIVGVKQVVPAGEKKSREVISQQGSSMEVY